ncbi:efflux protein, mate family [Halogeometricum borinquense DSM 11551]|nr:MATE family efflux transporter [Halogeometricum borinquense]ELY24866.1 efflux protein, mate family [Halogeometricum borinquense DSM 11551]RYJ12999.1 MATE family efflux transporter [Halogeometricum borinquense]
MTSGAITPKLVSLSWPLVAGNLLQTFYNLADMFWVGRVGPKAVAAVSLMFPTAWMFVSVAMGVTAAAVALVSQHVGAGDDRAAERVVGQSLLLAIGVGVLLAIIGYLGRHQLLTLIGAQGRVYTEALAYAEVLFVTLPFTFVFFAFRAVLRGAGDTRTAMWLVVVSAGLNVILDPLFILGYGPFSAMGTRGAAVATLVARIVAAAAGLSILLHGGWGARLRIPDLRPDPTLLRKLVDVGYPATLDGLARSFAAVALAALVARFGSVATAAYGIGLRLMSVSWTVSGAVGQAAATGVGQNLGANTPDRAAEVTWKATAGTMAILGAVGGVVWAFPAVFMRVFIDDAPVVAAGVEMLTIIAPFWAFLGGLMVIQGAFRGAGRTRVSMVLSLISRWVVRFPAAFVLAYTLSWGVTGLWWGLSLSGIVTFVVGCLWFLHGEWRSAVVDEDDTEDDDAHRDTDETPSVAD